MLERASSEILARLKRTKRETVAEPVHRNSGLPFLWIAEEDDLPELETGTLVEVELLEENKHAKKSSPAPSGRVLRALENTSDHELGFQLILNENLIRTEYPQGSLEHVKSFHRRYASTLLRVAGIYAIWILSQLTEKPRVILMTRFA